MGRKNLINILGIIAIALATVSCKVQPIELSSINNIKIETKNGISVTIDATLYNPNKVKIALQDVNIDAYLGKTYLGKIEVPDITVIERKGKFSATFLVKIAKQNSIGLGLSLIHILGKKQVEVNLKGTMFVKHWLMGKQLQINHTEIVNL